ncbi:MAG: P-loop NTPase fold protein [Syntrophobacterales bacterium]|jgi:predicted KAP-like P-loop ATPase/predicted RNase H-like HicB family nuclease|nr:P-loop NTPase fold protein [Syntrophobacterales bacterium]
MWRDSESEQDFLNFTEVAEQIATLAMNHDLLPISIGVFGGWGTGKSTVLRLVENKLHEAGDNAPVLITFDAWLYQGFDDARAALMEVVSDALLDAAKRDETLLDKAKNFAGRVNYFRALGLIADFGVGMAFGIPPGLLTRAGTAMSSIFSGTGTEEDKAELKGTAKEAHKGVLDLIKPAEKRTPPKEIEAFRKEFGEVLAGLDTTLVLFIDNLDRCLPDVAIGTLEAVRLFLFMPRTAFIIAADEGMIRHSVAKHFSDPQASHVRDYLDKVIQVPLRVPQVGAEDLRAYMYSLFVGLAAPEKLSEVQAKLMATLQGSWKGETFDKTEISKLAEGSPELLDNLAIADRLAPILAWAPNIQGNPRIVKRLLNAVLLRRLLAANREMNVDLATLAKLAVFERCTDEKATLELYRLVMEGKDAEKYLLPQGEIQGEQPELPAEWKSYEDFINKWRGMEPLFKDAGALRPAVFLSRDVMAPAPARADLSEAARVAVEALLKVDSVNSPVGSEIVEALSAGDRRTAMSNLIEAMREGDWSAAVPGIHGAIILAKASTEAEAELKAFLKVLQTGEMDKGILYLLKKTGMVGGSA